MTEERQPDEVLRQKAKELFEKRFFVNTDARVWTGAEMIVFADEFAHSTLAEARAQGMRDALRIFQVFHTRSDIWTWDEVEAAIERLAKEKSWNGTTTQTGTGQASQHQKSKERGPYCHKHISPGRSGICWRNVGHEGECRPYLDSIAALEPK